MKKRKFLSIILLAVMLVTQMAIFVRADDTKIAHATFKLASDLPKQDGGSILLLYSGESTDLCVELRPSNDFTYEADIPTGIYTLNEAISTTEADYSYDLADTLAIVEGDNEIEVIVTNKDLTDELRQARAKDLTERNKAREDSEETGLKVGDNIDATKDTNNKKSVAPIVICVILVVGVAVGLTVLTTVRTHNKKTKKDEEETLL